MNILLLLIPKDKVVYIYDYFTLRQALEKMEHHRFAALPIISEDGGYVGTITAGDLLWEIKRHQLNLKGAEDVLISSIIRKRDNSAIKVDKNVEDLIEKAIQQNFVPVLDDKESFIGIVTRKDIIQYCYKQMKK